MIYSSVMVVCALIVHTTLLVKYSLVVDVCAPINACFSTSYIHAFIMDACAPVVQFAPGKIILSVGGLH